MKPTEIAARGSCLREELHDLNREIEVLAADIVRDGVPPDWTTQEKDEARLLFLTIHGLLPSRERFEARHETLRAAIRIVTSNS